MIENGKISSLQMAMIINPTILSTAILLAPSVTGEYARQDIWLSPVWASMAGFIAIVLAILLHRRFPGSTFIQYAEQITGKWIGKGISFCFLLYLLFITGIIVREYGEFVVGSFLGRTPMSVVIGSMMLVSAFAVRGGLEVLGRVAQLFLPVVIVLYLWIVIFLIPDMDLSNMLPILSDGLVPSMKGAVITQGIYGEFFLIAFLLPFLSDQHKAFKWSVISLISVIFIAMITNFATLLLFGHILNNMTYPIMSAARYISITEFLEHLESIIMAIWVLGIYIKISMFFYALVLGTGQWLQLNDDRPLVLPFGLLIVLFSFWGIPDVQTIAEAFESSLPVLSAIIQLLLPALLLLLALFRKKERGTDGSHE